MEAKTTRGLSGQAARLTAVGGSPHRPQGGPISSSWPGICPAPAQTRSKLQKRIAGKELQGRGGGKRGSIHSPISPSRVPGIDFAFLPRQRAPLLSSTPFRLSHLDNTAFRTSLSPKCRSETNQTCRPHSRFTRLTTSLLELGPCHQPETPTIASGSAPAIPIRDLTIPNNFSVFATTSRSPSSSSHAQSSLLEPFWMYVVGSPPPLPSPNALMDTPVPKLPA